eukprot:13890875-Alexandrium_andersonii.AAC.1
MCALVPHLCPNRAPLSCRFQAVLGVCRARAVVRELAEFVALRTACQRGARRGSARRARPNA